MDVTGFTPCGTVSIAGASTSASATLSGAQIQASQILVTNAGTFIAFIRWGVGAQTALATDLPILPGMAQSFSKGAADTIAAITASGTTTTLYITPGEGS